MRISLVQYIARARAPTWVHEGRAEKLKSRETLARELGDRSARILSTHETKSKDMLRRHALQQAEMAAIIAEERGPNLSVCLFGIPVRGRLRKFLESKERAYIMWWLEKQQKAELRQLRRDHEDELSRLFRDMDCTIGARDWTQRRRYH